MKNRDIFVFALIAIFLGLKLYQKYGKKNKTTSTSDAGKSANKEVRPSNKEEEYEPYSKR